MKDDKSRLPGCDTFTRPEEIKELSKYLGRIKKAQEEYVKLGNSSVLIPGDETLQFPEINELPGDIEKLDIPGSSSLPSSNPDSIPGERREETLSDFIDTLEGTEDIGLGEGPELKIPGNLTEPSLPQTIINLDKGQELINGLENETVKLEANNKELELSQTVIGIEGNLEEPALNSSIINLELKDNNIQLEDTLMGIDNAKGNEQKELPDTRLKIEGDNKDTALDSTIINLERKEEEISLGETLIGISNAGKSLSISSLPDTVLEMGGTEKDTALDSTIINLERKEKEISLGDTLIEINNAGDNLNTLPDIKRELKAGKWENQELEQTKVKINGEAKEMGLDQKKVNLNIDPENIELSNTRLDLDAPLDIELGDYLEGLGGERKEPELEDVRLELENWVEPSLSQTILELEGENKDPKLSETVLEVGGEKKEPNLSETVLKIRNEKEPKLPGDILKIRNEKEPKLPGDILKIRNDKEPKLPTDILKIRNDKEPKLPEDILKVGRTREQKLEQEVKEQEKVKGENNKALEITENQNPNGEVEGLYDTLLSMADNDVRDSKDISEIDLRKLNDDQLFNRLMSLLLGDKDFNDLTDSWKKKLAALVSSYLSSSIITPEKADEFLTKVDDVVSVGAYSVALGGMGDKIFYTPKHNGKGFDIKAGLGNISGNIRTAAEKTAATLKPGTPARRALLETTLWLLIAVRDAAEELTHTSRSSLPGYVPSNLTSLARGKSLKDMVTDTTKSVLRAGVSGLIGTGSNPINPTNYPDIDNPLLRTTSTKGFQRNNNRTEEGSKTGPFKNALKSMAYALESSLVGDFLLGNRTYSFKDHYLKGTGINLTLKDLCLNSKPDTVEGLMDTLKSSPYITTPRKFGTIERGLYNSQTLDQNSYWEVILEPFVNTQLNGGYSYLPAIHEINSANKSKFGVTTGYNSWIPIVGFELQKQKVGTKSLGLYDGEISYPSTVEFTNEVRITIVDDQYKSWRRYFETCAKAAVFNSTPHDSNYYTDATGTSSGEKTVIDQTNICVSLYKNITFRCQIYIMTPQYATVRKYDLLLVMKDFSEEYTGDIDASASDLTISFSIVGENPPETPKFGITIFGTNGIAITPDYVKMKEAALKNKISSRVSTALSIL